jgi:hypothetical protein
MAVARLADEGNQLVRTAASVSLLSMCGRHFGEGEHQQTEPIIRQLQFDAGLASSRDVVEPIDFVDSRAS